MIVPPDIIDIIIAVVIVILLLIAGIGYMINMISQHDDKAWWDEHV